jgi:hypothetical protein
LINCANFSFWSNLAFSCSSFSLACDIGDFSNTAGCFSIVSEKSSVIFVSLSSSITEFITTLSNFHNSAEES